MKEPEKKNKTLTQMEQGKQFGALYTKCNLKQELSLNLTEEKSIKYIEILAQKFMLVMCSFHF